MAVIGMVGPKGPVVVPLRSRTDMEAIGQLVERATVAVSKNSVNPEGAPLLTTVQDSGEYAGPAWSRVDVGFMTVAVRKADVDVTVLRDLLEPVRELTAYGPSWRHMARFMESAGLGLRLMGLGHAAGLWAVRTPADLFGFQPGGKRYGLALMAGFVQCSPFSVGR